MEKRDRFLLEQKIMQCWNVTDDMDTISEYIADSDISPVHQDQLLNMLFGMRTLYNQKFNSTMNLFSELVRNGDIKSDV
jgi:hypothetical protein